MAPSKKTKSAYRRSTSVNDIPSKKDSDAAIKSGRKRKLSDMLGPQWGKRELERFYEAYRKYGKDWKKVAVAVRNRSVEMVEALYTMNRAYLSLPEGTASVVGLVAMMTDHYTVLGGSDSEQESNEGTETPRKPQKRARVKVQNSPAKGSENQYVDLLPFQSSAANLSLFKKKRSGSRPRAVGKRTPRVPVSYSYSKDMTGSFLSPLRQDSKQKEDATDDDVAHEIALVLTEASQRGGSPQVSRTPSRQRANTESEMTSGKHQGSGMDEDDLELSLGSTETDSVGALEARGRGKKYNGQKQEVDDGVDNDLDDLKEACSGTEEGPELSTVKGKFEGEAKDSKSARTPRKKSEKLLFGEGNTPLSPSKRPSAHSFELSLHADEATAFDALQTLADLSLMQTTMDTDSATQIEGTKSETAEKSDLNGNHSISVVEPTKLSALDSNDMPKGKGSSQINTGTRKVRQRSWPLKVSEDETHANSQLDLPQQAKDEAKSVSKTKRSQITTHPKQGKSVKTPERSSSSTEHGLVPSTVQAPSTNQTNLPTKARSKRKTEVPKRLIDMDVKPLENIVHSQSSVPNLKKNLSNCLSWILMRRWCAYEWFYSAIDYPWFAREEFVEYLDHVGLSHIPRLTRVEWGVIRSSLGKPRRFSAQLLKEEKEKLNQYRESVRKTYSELRNGTREGLPTDLARPLSVGQRVIAIHPKTGEFHNGSILTVDYDKCRVQFARPELGVEFVMDINCMPLNPLENLPACLMRRNVTFDRVSENFKELKMNGQLNEVPCEKLESADGLSDIPTSIYPINALVLQDKGGSQVKAGSHDTIIVQQATNSRPFGVQIQAKETDVRALTELARAVDKKEAVVGELRCLNDEIEENQKVGDNSLKESESFKKQYAAVLFLLNEANEQVSSALYSLRQRNTYQGNSPLALLKPAANIAHPGNFTATLDQSQETGSHVAEIVESSKTKAQKLVGAAVQAVKTLKKGDNGVESIEEVIDFLSNRLCDDDFTMSTTPVEPAINTLVSQVEKKTTPSAADAQPETETDETETQIPSQLIERCVATLLMIQKCTERHFPPGEVAQVLDYAMTSLQPCCSTNLPIYGEIQKCMGVIRNQILALVPT